MKKDLIVIIDFGSQYNQLIARRIRDLGVYSILVDYHNIMDTLKKYENIKGIVLSGGPKSVYDEDAFIIDDNLFSLNVPILGVCYGMQYMTKFYGGYVSKASKAEYGKALINVKESMLFKNTNQEQIVWMSHSDKVTKAPDDFNVIAGNDSTPIAAFENKSLERYGVQFHPEVRNTEHGIQIIKNFVFEVCNCSANWHMSDYKDELIENIKTEVKDKKVLLGISGGVDSTVTAVLINKAIGSNLTCMFINHGLLREDEEKEVRERFEKNNINVVYIDASKKFLTLLKGVEAPEQKRKIIGKAFIETFDEEVKKIGKYDYLAQGTLYTDIIESGTSTAQTIKSHHNVGGLPENVPFKLLEPLKCLFKDEVRQLGRELGIDDELINRQPFPGPGLAIRVIGEITEEKLTIVRKSDKILRDEIKLHGLDKSIWQYFTVVTNTKTVGVKGDNRSYDYCVAIRAVDSIDGMTANWAKIPYEVLEIISTRIINEVNNVNRVVYDITSKPPGTIEWE